MSIDFTRLQAQYATAADLLRRPGATAHFVGVAGVGMAGLARLLCQAGFRVSGCDSHADAPSVPPLRTLGVSVLAGHSPAHLDALDPARGDFLVRTPAADPSSPELAAAVERGLTVLDRGTVLAAFLDVLPHPLIAVCGTHGKTTTATFATALLRALGLAPGCCIGAPDAPATLPGVLQGAASAAPTAGSGGSVPRPLPFVAECDESDGTLALYHPAITVLNSVDFDHAEHFASEAEFLAVFDAVLSQTRRAIVYNADDNRLAAYIAGMGRLFRPGHRAPETLSIGTGENARLRATALSESADGTAFNLSLDGAPLGRFHLPIPGHHNLLNALAAIGALAILRPSSFVLCPLQDPLQAALATLRLPGRRFETISTADGIRVVADYAHHPAELAAAIAMARQTLSHGGRLIGVFQPHRPSRTKALGPAFVPALATLDDLALAPVYAASEPDIPGGSIADLYALFRKSVAGPVPSGPPPVLLPTLSSALPWLRATARPGDTVLLLGAGDIISLAGSFDSGWNTPPPLPPALRSRGADSSAPYCSFGVGGPVRAIAHVGTLEALRDLLAWCRDTATPWRVLGAGTNFLVSDAGFDGLLLHLEGSAFQEAFSQGGSGGTVRGGSGDTPERLVIGAALPGARLLSSWQSLGYSGLECMDGIPGTVGGWLAMNAGAQGHAIGDCLESVTLLFPDGGIRTLPKSSLSLGYRTASLSDGRPLSSCVILSAVFAPRERTTPEVVAERRAAFRAKRFDFRGLRTAGSVFRNPPGDSAGRILDAAGLKGLRIGGAEICPRHANIICAHPGATVSDVLALIQIAQQRSPVPLHPEITIL